MFYCIFWLCLPDHATGEVVKWTGSILIKHTTAILNVSQYVSYNGLIYVPCKLHLSSQFSKVIYGEICFILHLNYLKPFKKNPNSIYLNIPVKNEMVVSLFFCICWSNCCLIFWICLLCSSSPETGFWAHWT